MSVYRTFIELHHEQGDLQNEAVCRGLVLQMAREHLNRLDGSKSTGKAVKVVVVVAKRQAVDVDVGGTSPKSALKQRKKGDITYLWGLSSGSCLAIVIICLEPCEFVALILAWITSISLGVATPDARPPGGISMGVYV